jgi:hypothetical protein
MLAPVFWESIMLLKRLALIGLLFGAGVATSACTDGYGYSGVNVGYGSGGYYDGGYGGYGGYGGGYGYGGYPSYFGWYGDYYYPGTGIYVYDQYRRPYRWNDGQRRYWEQRRNGWRGDRNFRNDWNGFDRSRGDGFRGDRGPGFRGDRTPGVRGDGVRGDRTPGIRGDGIRGDRGNWRGNRQNFSGTPQAATPQAVAPAGGGQPRGWGGGNRGGGPRGGGPRGGGGGWRGRR